VDLDSGQIVRQAALMWVGAAALRGLAKPNALVAQIEDGGVRSDEHIADRGEEGGGGQSTRKLLHKSRNNSEYYHHKKHSASTMHPNAPRIQRGPAGGGMSMPSKPEMHSVWPACVTCRTYCSPVRV
jgi:hypothetical protein